MSDRTKDVRVSEHTKKLMKEHNYKPRNMNIKHKYYRKDAMVNLDYNLLKYQYPVRKFIQKKYKITLRELEILLYLFPIGYFTHRDYKDFPTTFTHRQIISMMKKGHVKIFLEGENKAKHVYCLTQASQLKVQNYYKYLTGELIIPTISENNPMIRKNASSHENKINSMFKKMAKQNAKKK